MISYLEIPLEILIQLTIRNRGVDLVSQTRKRDQGFFTVIILSHTPRNLSKKKGNIEVA